MPRYRRLALIALAAVSLTAGCARGLSPNEVRAAKALFGDTLDTSEITVSANLGLLPLPPEPPAPEGEAAAPAEPPKDLCVRKRSTKRSYRGPAAFALFNDLYFAERFYTADTFAGFPNSVPYPSSLIMAHELVHVWQWQNRDVTGYSPLISAGESWEQVDPYFFEARGRPEYLSYGYEQQGAILQDFVCYALFDRDSPRVEELARILRPVFPVDNFLAVLDDR